jgi:RNA polymerase sigma-70 factor (ECF subfamily)
MDGSPQIESQAAEAELLARLRAGNDAAFAELIRRHSGRLLAVVRRLLRREEDAQDALQEAFLSAFRALDKFDGRSQLGTWLHRIAVNCALMKLRAQQRRPEQSIDDLLPTFYDDGHRQNPGPAWKLTADRAVEQAETRELVRRAIDQLPDSYRVVLVLRDIEQWDTAAVAEHLGIEAGAVKTRLHRARQALRTLLDPHFRGELS